MPPATLDFAEVRTQFPILREMAYLNTGTYGIMAESVLEKYLEVIADFERRGMAAVHDHHVEISRHASGSRPGSTRSQPRSLSPATRPMASRWSRRASIGRPATR